MSLCTTSAFICVLYQVKYEAPYSMTPYNLFALPPRLPETRPGDRAGRFRPGCQVFNSFELLQQVPYKYWTSFKSCFTFFLAARRKLLLAGKPVDTVFET